MVPSRAFGRYALIEQLGRGGMATVFRAHDPEFDRDVALKVLPEELLQDPEFRTRFQREARTIARLEHPAIVPVYDIGEEQGQPYLVMRLMPGGALSQRLAKGPLSMSECVGLIQRIASALDEAHRQGMVHRDIKPGNILFDSYDKPHLADFGIVKLSQAATTLTGTGMIGTPAYMSPEQSEGRREVGPATDIYALGVVLFQMLTGSLPYDSDTPIGLALKHIKEPVPRLREFNPKLPAALQAVIDRAMAKKPEDRFPTAGDMALALEAVVSPTLPAAPVSRETKRRKAPAPAPKPPTPEIPTLLASRPRRSWLPVVLAAAALGLAGVAFLVFGRGLLGALAGLSSQSPSAEATPASSPTAKALPTITPTPAPSPTAVPAGILPENVGQVQLLWTAEVARYKRSPYVAWSPKGDTIAVSTGNQGPVALWDANRGELVSLLEDPATYSVGTGAWSPDGEQFAAFVLTARDTQRYILIIWRVSDGQVTLRIPLDGYWCRPAWSPDGGQISCGGRMYDAQTALLLWEVTGSLYTSAFSPDGALVALAGTGGDVRIYEAAAGVQVANLPAHNQTSSALSWSASDTLVSGARNGEIFGWPDLSKSAAAPTASLAADSGGFYALEWSPNGRVALSGQIDYLARLWSEDLEVLREFKHDGTVSSVTWSPDGRRFATGSADGLLRVWGLPGP